MAKVQRVILPIEEQTDIRYPHNNDILLYDSSKKVWYQTTKEDLLKAERYEIKRQAEEIESFKSSCDEKIEEQNKQINIMKTTISKLIELIEPYIQETKD